MKHAVTVTRSPLAGSPHLQGAPYFTWGADRPLNLVDDRPAFSSVSAPGSG
jgi:hypothetical protein